jgi:hypothetical protein
MSDSGNAIVSVASGQMGRADTDCPLPGCYHANHTEYCSEFVAWCYHEAGFPLTGGDEGGWLLRDTFHVIDWFKDHSTYLARGETDWDKFTPVAGDYIFIGRAGDPDRRHSGIVEFVDASGTLHTIEGNNAGRHVDRYVYPNFRTNSTSNDPPKTNGYVKGFGLRTGKNIKNANGTARASSSGDNRSPANAFDGNSDTFWRNRTQQSGLQFLEMDYGSSPKTVAKISLTFGNHFPVDYHFKVKVSGIWTTVNTITGNTSKTRAHVWWKPLKNVSGVRIYCSKYSADDYFSIYEMAIQR